MTLRVPACRIRNGEILRGFVELEVPNRSEEAERVGSFDNWPVYTVRGQIYERIQHSSYEDRRVLLSNLLNAGKYYGLTAGQHVSVAEHVGQPVDRFDHGAFDFSSDPIGDAMREDVRLGLVRIDDAFCVRTRGPAYSVRYGNGAGMMAYAVSGYHATYKNPGGFVANDLVDDDIVPSEARIHESWSHLVPKDGAREHFQLMAFARNLAETTSRLSIASVDLDCLRHLHALRRALYLLDGGDPYERRRFNSISAAWAPPRSAALGGACAAVVDQLVGNPAPAIRELPATPILIQQAQGHPLVQAQMESNKMTGISL